ncbi:DUF881 domain-containing protein [Georgenia sp. MJ170]|uniref:DUF881 domain-containing protein n=1 Tax=Georgenia sunbinii TaxID=3117728 RepID=UPI002F26C66A
MTLPVDPSESAPAPRRARRSVAVGLVAALAGLLFATNAHLFEGADQRSPSNLVELARAQTQRLEESEANVAELRAAVDTLIDTDDVAPVVDEATAEITEIAAGSTPLAGPGIVVEMWDAPAPPDLAAAGLHPDDLVVHQQDLEAVMNAMWAGGAEAMMVQDQRIVSTSAVRCIGNVLLLHGRHYSPPYRISAIGDTAELTAAVRAAPAVKIYQQYVAQVGLGWSQETVEEIEMPAYSGPTRMEHARAVVD